MEWRFAVVVALLAAGCAANKPVSPAPVAPEAPLAEGREPSADEVIGKEVRYRVATQCQNDAMEIKIIVSDAVVTLRGSVSSQMISWREQAAATAVRGVKTVRNELIVRGLY